MNMTEAERIFHEALRCSAGEDRSALLHRECGEDQALRSKVGRLLAALEEAPSFLSSPTQKGTGTVNSEGPGTRIGRYKLLQKLGEGGFGVVYMAEQMEPVKRRVALKIIKLGLDTKQVVARFEIERQALAMMDHPNIARVFDAGTTDQGRPYFVMELVRGVPITEYCDENLLGTRDRLELFIAVCHAVQHAHQKGVIHRDLKPRNILVTLHDGIPVPKVIDFGIAKATQHELTEKTVFTEFHQMIGTPSYMSPEQAEMTGLDIDTRSDIYALGVSLYELLTGRPPLDGKELMSAGYEEMRRRIKTEEPLRPSTRFASLEVMERTEVARRRKMEADRLGGELKGDLDWIVMKALEKDRTRRYDTAKGFANDICRHLNEEPVEAAAPSVTYRFYKFYRRHKMALTSGAALTFLLVIGTAVSSWQAFLANEASIRERQARKIAQSAEQDARAGQLAARRSLYAAELTLTAQSVRRGSVDRAIDLLKRQIPRGDEVDLRGFEWAYLWDRINRGRTEMIGHERDIYDVAISPDGRYVASAGDDTRLWDFHSGRELARIARRGSISARVDFSPDGTLLATTSEQEIILWDVLARKEVGRLNADSGQADRVRFAPDGTTLFVSSPNGEIQVWDLSTRRVKILKAHRWWTGKIEFTSDGSRIVTCAGDKTVKIWDRQSLELVAELTNHSAPVNDVACAPDRDVAVSCGRDGKVLLWDTRRGKLLQVLPLEVEQHGPVRAVSFSVDGSVLAAGFEGGRVSLLGTQEWNELASFHGSPILSLDLSPVENRLVTAGPAGRLVARDFSFDKNPGLPLEVNDRPRCVRLSPDGVTLAVGMEKGGIRVWDLATGRERLVIPEYRRHDPYKQNPFDLHFFDYSPDSRRLVTITDQAQLDVWDLQRGELKHSLLHTNRSYSVAWSPDGRHVAGGGHDGTVTLWDTDSRQPLQQIRAHATRVHFLVYSPDGKYLVTTSWDKTPTEKIKIWEVATGTLVQALGGHYNADGVGCVAFSPDGTLLATGAPDRRVIVWNTADWSERAALFGHAAPLADLSFSSDGTRLASGGYGGVIRLWDLASFQEVATLDGNLVEFSPQEPSLVTAQTVWFPNIEPSKPCRVLVHRPPSVADIDRQLQ